MGDRLNQILKDAFQDEAFRRMSRRAHVHATSQKDTDSVNWALRKVGEHILDNLCQKMAVYTEHQEKTTVNESSFKSACDFLKVKTSFYAVPSRDDGTFPKCRKYSPGARRGRRDRGTLASLESRHENKQDHCLYNESAPFIRLVREIIGRYNGFLRFSPQALSGTQYVTEQILINILRAAGKS